MTEFVSKSEQDTINFACEFAKTLDKSSTIILVGDLGSGKTKFTQGILKHFNLEDEISSPTFTIVNEYNANEFNIYHFDLYRLEDVDEFYAMGGEDYLQNGICIFEWGELIEPILPKGYIKIKFTRVLDNPDYRKLEIINC